MKIWKYEVGSSVITDEVIGLAIPKDARILYVDSQREIPCIWAMVDPSTETETRFFYIAATGETVPKGKYIGTFFQQDGAYVWHLFECLTV